MNYIKCTFFAMKTGKKYNLYKFFWKNIIYTIYNKN